MSRSLSTISSTVNIQNNTQRSDAETSPTNYNPQIVKAFLELLDHRNVGVTEIRILLQEPYLNINGQRTYVGKTVVGYYEPNQYEKASQDIAPFDGKAQIYVVLNPCVPELLARCSNRLQFSASHTASDNDIAYLQWFRIDCDPIRPSGISASDTELEKALLCRDDIAASLEAYGAQVTKAMSGNGGHLLIRLPNYRNDEEHRSLIVNATKRIADKWSNDAVTVDVAVCNPARVWKVYGTLAVKGDNVPNRPHRRATIELPSAPPLPFDLKQLPHEEPQSVTSPKLPDSNLCRSPTQERAYAVAALENETKRVESSPDGQKHSQLLRSAAALGSLVPSGAINEQEIEERLFGAVQNRASDTKQARKTIRDGIRYGFTRPRQVPETKSQAAVPNTLKNLKNPSSDSFLGSLGCYPNALVNFNSDPQPFAQSLRPVPPLLAPMLPTALRDWLADIAERMNCPLEYAAVPAIVALSSLIGCKVGIRPKQRDDWTVVPNLWGACVGSPGQRKTPAANEAMKPLRRLESEAMKAYQEAVTEFLVEAEIASAQSKAAKDALQKAARKPGATGDELRAIAEQTQSLEQQEPVQKRYKINDATVEALGERLKENPTGLLLYRDELTGLLRSLYKQGHETDRAFYLEAWNGTEKNYHYDRIGRGTVSIPSVCLSLFGTIQPGPLSKLLRGAANGEEADGLFPRFQLLVYPDAPKYRHIDRSPNIEAKNRAFEVFRALDQLDVEALTDKNEEDGSIPFLHFEPDAQHFFDEWLTDLESEKLPAARDTPLIESHLAKYRSLMPSLALLFHLIDMVDGAPASAVSQKATHMAAAWCDFLEEHARRIYQIAYDGSLESVSSLAGHIKDGSIKNLKHWDGTRFKIGDVVQRGWSSLSTTEEVNRAAAFLEERHWLQVVESPPALQGGRPERWIYVHPNLQQGKKPEGGEAE